MLVVPAIPPIRDMIAPKAAANKSAYVDCDEAAARQEYFGRRARVPDEFAVRRQQARKQPLEQNRRAACDHCSQVSSLPAEDVAA